MRYGRCFDRLPLFELPVGMYERLTVPPAALQVGARSSSGVVLYRRKLGIQRVSTAHS